MPHTHDDFLSAIAAAPADRTLRLVYADWLDEQSDARGELVRVEEEMRELPVFADRFWALKPRRNDLRAQAGPEWCGRMRYGTECEPVFRHGIPDGWRERWRLIREFTERWHRVPMPDVGGRQAEIAEAESRLGRALPPSVREWVAFAHDAHSLAEKLDMFDSGVLEREADEPVIRLWLGADRFLSLAYVAVRKGELSVPDPLVHGYRMHVAQDDIMYSVVEGLRPNSVSSFSLDHLVTALDGEWGGYVLSTDLKDEDGQHLHEAFPVYATLEGIEYFEADNLIVRLTPRRHQARMTLSVQVAAQVDPTRIPPVVVNLARHAVVFHGNLGPPDGIPF